MFFSVRDPYLPMVQDMNTACNAEMNNLGIEMTNAAVKLIAFLCVSINMKYRN